MNVNANAAYMQNIIQILDIANVHFMMFNVYVYCVNEQKKKLKYSKMTLIVVKIVQNYSLGNKMDEKKKKQITYRKCTDVDALLFLG